MEMAAYCLQCNDERDVKKVGFFGKKLNLTLNCGHHQTVWAVAVTSE